MKISLDEGFFFVTCLPDDKTEITHKGGTFIMDKCSVEDLESLAKEFDASPWIMYADGKREA
jgi:hypothetical protein